MKTKGTGPFDTLYLPVMNVILKLKTEICFLLPYMVTSMTGKLTVLCDRPFLCHASHWNREINQILKLLDQVQNLK